MVHAEERIAAVVRVACLRRSNGRIERYRRFRAEGPEQGRRTDLSVQEVLGVCKKVLPGERELMGFKCVQRDA